MTDERDDDPQLKSPRAVWLEMRDEDPPSRGLDALMAAARTQATAMTPAPWWKRMVEQLRRPSVLAFASLVLLVGGAVVLTRHDDAIEKAQPTIAPSREVETPAANKDVMAPTGAVAPTPPPLAAPSKPEEHQVKTDTRTVAPPRAHHEVHATPNATGRGQGTEATAEARHHDRGPARVRRLRRHQGRWPAAGTDPRARRGARRSARDPDAQRGRAR
jgi:hypothetical protein